MTAMVTKQSGKEVEWQRWLARFARSGQQVKQFFLAECMSMTTFYRWHKLLGEVPVGRTVAASSVWGR